MVISNKSYLVKAIYQWCSDCGYTPHVLAGVGYDGMEVPDEYVTDGQIVFSLAEDSTRHLEISQQSIAFLATFDGSVIKINLPMDSVVAIYAHENGDGITFDDEDQIESMIGLPDLVEEVQLSLVESTGPSSEKGAETKPKIKPNLTIIK